ncbi:hypothetical protein P8C59_007777 [Phyllachora maydis]|nr:hypothetical protein P8C59_007777 [Phyllachora maydis]
MIPEFSHLALNEETRRNSVETQHAAAPPGGVKRRGPKTPIHYMGYLDGLSLPRPPNAFGSEKRSSVHLIADRYRALLEPRSPVYAESCYSEPPPPSRRGGTRSPALAVASPTSDHSLVALEDETVYFQSLSVPPEPQSPNECDWRPTPSPSVAPDNLSMQISLDLLTRDLAAGLASRPIRSSPEASALQVWVMIEAYERLREQLHTAQPRHEERAALDMMLNLWLGALWRIHDVMMERTGSPDSEHWGSGYGSS